jgi:hypothetical protein
LNTETRQTIVDWIKAFEWNIKDYKEFLFKIENLFLNFSVTLLGSKDDASSNKSKTWWGLPLFSKYSILQEVLIATTTEDIRVVARRSF